MPDYKEMYLTMARKAEEAVMLAGQALHALITAQCECEETEPVTVLPTAEDVIETLFYEVTTEVVYDPNNRRPDPDALKLSEEEETESRYRLTEILDGMEEDRDHWIAYMDAYFKDYQERFT